MVNVLSYLKLHFNWQETLIMTHMKEHGMKSKEMQIACYNGGCYVLLRKFQATNMNLIQKEILFLVELLDLIN